MKLREVCIISLYLLSAQNTSPSIASGQYQGWRERRLRYHIRYDHGLVQRRIPKGGGQEMGIIMITNGKIQLVCQ